MDGRQRLKAYAIAAMGLLVAALALWPPSFHLTDHYIFWTVGHAIVSGASPYDPVTWSDAARRYANVNVDLMVGSGGVVWPYPPWTGYLFVPFGALPLELGLWTLHAAYLAVGIAAAVALARRLPWNSWATYALGLLILPTFQPFIYSERLGHFGGFLLAGAVLAGYGLERSSAPVLAVAALLLIAKPSATLIFGLVITFALVHGRRWRLVVPVGLALALVAALSAATYPEAFAALFVGSTDRLALLGAASPNPVPSVWAIGSALGPVAAVSVGFGLTALLGALAVRAVRGAPAELRGWTLVAAALVVSVTVTPYVFSYDHVLLLPAGLLILAAASRADRRRGLARRGLALIAAVVIVTFVPWLAFFVGVGLDDHRVSVIVPLAFAALLAVGGPVRRVAA